MSFLDKYHVVSVLSAGETNSFRAVEAGTARQVIIHQIVSGQPSGQQPDLLSMIYEYLPGTGTPGTEHFLDSGQEGDRIFIVTSDVPACQSLRGWLQYIANSRSGVAAAPSIPTPVPAAEPRPAPAQPESAKLAKDQPGEFTGMFGAPSPAPAGSVLNDDALFAAPSAPTTSAAAAPAVPPAAPSAEKKAPGTFTSMFLSPTASAQNPPAAAPAQAEAIPEAPVRPPEKRPRGQVPSGFQVVAQSRKTAQTAAPAYVQPVPPSAPFVPPQELSVPTVVAPALAPPVAPQPAIQQDSPGGFTQMFAAMSPPPAAKPPAAQKPPTAPASYPVVRPPTPTPPLEDGPSEFTQMFEPIGTTSKPALRQPVPPASRPIVTQPLPPSAPVAAPRQAGLSDGPGEFTNMFSAPHATINPQSVPPMAPKAADPIVPSRVNAPPARPTAPPAANAPGEFTGLFQSPVQASPKPTMPAGMNPQPVASMPPQGVSPSISAFPASTPTPSGPGEFTGLFQTGGAPVAPQKGPLSGTPAPPSVPLSSSAKMGPSDFTMMMQGYKSPTTPPPPPAALDVPVNHAPPPDPNAGKPGPGEFTMLFRNPTAQPSPNSVVTPPPQPPPTARPVTPPPKSQRPGEYTSLFEAPKMPASQPQSAPPPGEQPGYGYPNAQVNSLAAPQMPAYQPPTAPQVSYQSPQAPQLSYQAPQGPQVSYQPPQAPQLQAPQMQPLTVAPPQPAAPTGKKPTIFWVMLFGLGALFLIAVILIVIFAMKR